jgi:hypothetical protein
VYAEITLIDLLFLFIELGGTVRTGCHASLASDAFLLIMKNYAEFLFLGICPHRASFQARWFLTVIAGNRKISHFGVRIFSTFLDNDPPSSNADGKVEFLLAAGLAAPASYAVIFIIKPCHLFRVLRHLSLLYALVTLTPISL